MSEKRLIFRLGLLLNSIDDLTNQIEAKNKLSVWRLFSLNFKVRLCCFKLDRLRRKTERDGVFDA